MRTFLFLFLVSLLATAARAQSAHWEPSGGTLPFDQDFELKLVFDNCTPKDDSVKPPPVAGLQLDIGSRSSGFSLINGQSSSSYTITYLAHPTKSGSLQLAAFTAATDKGDVRVPAVAFDVDNASPSASGSSNSGATNSLADAARAKLAPASGEFWAGEVFPISYTLDLSRRYRPQGIGDLQWSPTPLTVEDWAKPEQFELSVNGEPHLGVAYKARGYAKTPGDITLPPARQQVQLAMSNSPFDPFGYAFPRVVERTVASNAPTLTIKSLPPPPADFSGAVGQFTFTSKVVPASVAVGEPVTWTLALNGTGNWPDISGLPERQASQDFQVVPSKPKRELKNGSLFDATLSEDAVLIPTKPGAYTLPPAEFTYFDPKAGLYKTLTTGSFTVTVTPAAENKNNQPAAGAGNTAPAAASLKLPPLPVPPAAIPRDPLTGTADAPVPWDKHTFAAALLAPFALLLLFWLGLALRRARATDPRRAQREAHARLAATLAQLRTITDANIRARLLLAWQHDAAVLAQLHHAAPPADALADPAWQQLWRETERTLYAAGAGLPADWPDRAAKALAARPAPKFSAVSLLLPRNLLPFAFAIAVVLTLRAAAPTPADAAVAYRAGDFATAEAGWRDALAHAPTDWIAHHNLGLALGQQDRWPEAAAQWSAAFVQHPDDETLRWHLALGFDHAGYSASELATFVSPGPLQLVARLASPAEWQRVLVALAALAALALALLIARAYGHVRPWTKYVALPLLVLASLAAVAAGAGLYAYGPAADAHAALVWRAATLHSIPTEADTAQKTSPLSAGNLAVADKTFLGWSRLVFDNGQTGWVRTEDLVSLWR
ncbi:MAG TPA: BatD family protein [Opitutaceae bacterium]|jgi:hypothetical protein|nr:BatD family protein [Opitutaceae bacterium]